MLYLYQFPCQSKPLIFHLGLSGSNLQRFVKKKSWTDHHVHAVCMYVFVCILFVFNRVHNRRFIEHGIYALVHCTMYSVQCAASMQLLLSRYTRIYEILLLYIYKYWFTGSYFATGLPIKYDTLSIVNLQRLISISNFDSLKCDALVKAIAAIYDHFGISKRN